MVLPNQITVENGAMPTCFENTLEYFPQYNFRVHWLSLVRACFEPERGHSGWTMKIAEPLAGKTQRVERFSFDSGISCHDRPKMYGLEQLGRNSVGSFVVQAVDSRRHRTIFRYDFD